MSLMPTKDALRRQTQSAATASGAALSAAQLNAIVEKVSSNVSANLGSTIQRQLAEKNSAEQAEIGRRREIANRVYGAMNKISAARVQGFLQDNDLLDNEKISSVKVSESTKVAQALADEIAGLIIEGDFAMRKLSMVEAELGGESPEALAALIEEATGQPVSPEEAEALIAEATQLAAADEGVSNMEPGSELYAEKESHIYNVLENIGDARVNHALSTLR